MVLANLVVVMSWIVQAIFSMNARRARPSVGKLLLIAVLSAFATGCVKQCTVQSTPSVYVAPMSSSAGGGYSNGWVRPNVPVGGADEMR